MIPFRLAIYYGTSFLVMGIHLPFWPIWLESRGLTAEQIGAVIASGFVMKVLANPIVAHQADRRGERKRIIAVLMILSLCSFLLFSLTGSFWSILLVNGLFLLFWSPAIPLMESLTLQGSMQLGFDYGRVRLWGSVTFILAAVGIGYGLRRGPADMIFVAIALTITLTCISAWWLPDIRTAPSNPSQLTVRVVAKDRRFLIFLLAAALLQSSHAVFYGFGTLHWRQAGIGSDIIGGLWAEGVIVEIVVFIFGARILRRVGPARLMALAGLAAAVRWTGTGLTTALPALVLLQALHGLTFGGAHLGAMYFIQSRIAPDLSATAQSLYSGVVMGIGMGATALFSGHLYGLYGGAAFFPMAVMGGAGGLIIFQLRRRHLSTSSQQNGPPAG